MDIIYSSRTGNVRKLLNKLELDIEPLEINDSIKVKENYVLFTYTDANGQIPEKVKSFLGKDQNYKMCLGVISSGNRNFGNENFGRAADLIKKEFNIPVLKKFELTGFQNDVFEIKDILNKLKNKKEIDK